MGARSLEECLLLQLRRLPGSIYSGPSHLSGPFGGTEQGALWGVGPAAGGHPAAGGRRQPGRSAPSPSPVGEGVEPPAVPFIRPDVWVAEMDGELRVFVNQWDLPQYQVSQTYRQMLRGGVEAETADYLRQKLQQAQWVLTCVQRRRKTLEACVQAGQAQAAYFGAVRRRRGRCCAGRWRCSWGSIPPR
ncbi:MAG: hypothetical protein ACLRWL_04665 [Evtepia gabavorous]